MSVLAPQRRMEDYDPLRDKSYQATRLGRSVVDFLAWLELGGAAERTLDQYERDLARGALLFPRKGLTDLSDGDALQIAKLFKPAERPKRVAAWNSMYRWARKTRQVDSNPFDALPDFKPRPRKVIDVFSDEEINLLCDLPLRDGALMQLLFDAGLRKGEARRFKFMHLRGEEVLILGGKGGKDRIVPASPQVMVRLNELALIDGLRGPEHLWYSTMKTPHLERTLRAQPVGEGTFHRWWVRCLDDAGVRSRNPHTARHTFATRYLRNGGTLERLSLAMGHASIKTTFDLYAHLDTRDIADEFERVFQSIRG